MNPEHFDVLIVGAGVSGIGVAYHLQKHQPGKTYALLESREATGGTWDLFRYPGIRSDSDLHTFGYVFKPWTDPKSIADGPAILDYVRETASENGIDRHIRTQHKVVAASWSGDDARWTVEVERGDTGETVTFTCHWLFAAGGYYDYDEGFTPEFPGIDEFQGQVIHPQHWPEDLEYAGKRVVVIGSGATAVTLVPAMAPDTEHITMLQRSPTYVMPVPEKDPIANALRRVVSEKRAYAIARRKNILQQRYVYRFCQAYPKLARKLIRKVNASQLPKDFDVDTHFNPTYDPWDQRLCAVPNGDLFKALRKGTASIVTDRIKTFTAGGIVLESGKELEADIVITATGLNIKLFGGVSLTVDGKPVVLNETVAYKGMMLSGIPNFAFAVGYTNSSWTLKVDLVGRHLARILAHMDEHGHQTCVAETSREMELKPLLDLKAGYVQRALDRMPRKGEGETWQIAMDYDRDRKLLLHGPVEDGDLHFGTATRAGESSHDPVEVAV